MKKKYEIKELNLQGWVAVDKYYARNVYLKDKKFSIIGWDYKSLGEIVFDHFDGIDYPTFTVNEDDWQNGDYRLIPEVFVRYYVANLEITWDEVSKDHIEQMAGSMKLQEKFDGYSEVTILDSWTDMFVGTHNLSEEIASYDGKYVLIKISYKIKSV